MLIGTLQPEEFARGNFGRFRVLNGFRGKDGAHQALRALASEGVRETHVATFARLHRVPLRDVLAKHTVLPFAAFSVVSEDDEDGAFWHRRTIATYGFGIVRAHAYCCLECVTEDRVLGYSYWRVHHQLPGTYHCPIHGCRLHRTTSGLAAFDLQPAATLMQAELTPVAVCPAESSCAAVTRFNAFVGTLARLRRPLKHITYQRVVVQRAYDLGYAVYPASRSPRVSDAVLRMFPVAWLHDVLPSVRMKRANHNFKPLDYCVRKGIEANSTARCLVLAVMYESPQKLFQDIEAAEKCETSSQSTHKHKVRLRNAEDFTAFGE